MDAGVAAARASTKPARRCALVATALGFGVVQLDVTIVNVAMQPIGAALGGSTTGLQWIVNAYTLALASLILSAGAWGDRIGAKRVFVGGFAMFILASAACGLAPSLGVLIAARAAQGIGAAVLIPCSLTLLTHSHPGAERARAVGVWAACASLALSAGPLVGGVLIDAVGWRAIFFINAPLGVLGIALTLRYAAETPRTPRRIDLPGQALAIVALCALAASTITGGKEGFTAPLVLVGYGVAVVALVGFLRVELHSREPMLPLPLFRSRTFSATTSAVGLLVNVAIYGLIFVLSLDFQTVRGASVLATGMAFLPMTAAVFVGNLLAGRIVRASGVRPVLAGSAVLIAAALAGLLIVDRSTPFTALVAQLVLLGFGVGVVVPTMTTALLGSVEPTRSGVASAP